MTTNNLIQILQSELRDFRMKQYRKSNVCPIINQTVPFEKTVVDHKHKTKQEIVGVEGKGLIRGILSFQANAWEGKVSNSFKRLGLHKYISLPEALRNLANYLENPPLGLKYIHPSGISKKKKLNKNCFNKLKKIYDRKYSKRKPLSFPKRGYLTQNLQKLFTEFKIKIIYNK